MRIVMLAHRLPYPPRSGERVRAYHVARHLAQSHDLTLVCLADEPDAESARETLAAEVGDVLCETLPRRRKRVHGSLALLGGRSVTVAYFDSPALHARLASRFARERADLVYVYSSSMTQYVGHVPHGRLLMDFVDVDSDKWRQYADRLPPPAAWAYRLESARLRQVELAAASRADRCLLVARSEEALLHSFAPWAPTTVMPQGVDLAYFAPPHCRGAEPAIVFTGVMDYMPNIDAVTYFCSEIWPRVQARVPAASFTIVGKSPAPSVRRLVRCPGVRVTGAVYDVRPFLWGATVAVAPFRIARGVQTKVLEAMATGLPVVVTSRANQGVEAYRGEELLVEDGPDEFAEAVIRLLTEPALRARVGARARAFVERHHSWSACLRVLDGVLDELTRASASAARASEPCLGSVSVTRR